MTAVPRSLVRAFAWLALSSLCVAAPAFAHHILGIPHYAYDEDYPQTPVLTYRVNAGLYEVRMTGYPGMLEPGDQCSFHVYVRELGGGRSFDGEVTMTLFEDRLLGSDPVVYGPMKAELDESVYKFYPRFEREANYTARIEFLGADEPWILDVPMVAGEPGSPWAVLGSVGGGLVVFLVVMRAARIKMRRRAAGAASDRDWAPSEAA